MQPSPRLLIATLLTSALLAANVEAGWQDWAKPLQDAAAPLLGSAGAGASGLSQGEITQGLREALEVGIQRAVEMLGKPGGFLDDPQVRIPLPESLSTVEKGLRAVGQDQYADQFIDTMNQAAEQAVPATLDIFVETIKGMSLEDAKGLLDGPQDAATLYLKEHAGPQLRQAIAPIVGAATDKVGVTSAYKQLTSNLGFLGQFSDSGSLDVDQYVTDKTLDGLFLKLAEEEKRIREDPLARSTELLKQVFGASR